MQPLNSTLLPNEFIDEYLPVLPGSCVAVFLFLARMTTGFARDVREQWTKAEIAERSGYTEKIVNDAINVLKEEGLVCVKATAGGRGRGNSYSLNYDPEKRGVEIRGVKKTPVKIGALHGFSNDLFLDRPAPEQPTRPATPVAPATPPQALKQTKPSKSKRSDEEKMAFDATWKAFEAGGQKLSGSLQAKSIWEMIDRVKDRSDWPKFLARMTGKFIEILSKKPKGVECISSQPRLPHILAGEKIWARVELLLSKAPQENRLTDWERKELKRIEREEAKEAGVCF